MGPPDVTPARNYYFLHNTHIAAFFFCWLFLLRRTRSARSQCFCSDLSGDHRLLLGPGKKMLSFRLTYIFVYNLFQFCGHTWILSNTIARFLTFGQDALADTFYSVGFVMSLCQLLSFLELFHIADGIEKARLLPRFIHVMEKNVLLVMVIMLEEMQSEPVVCLLFLLWNILDLLRYPHELLCAMDTPSMAMLWTRYTLWIPLYTLSVAAEGLTIYQAMPYLKPITSTSNSLNSTETTSTNLPFALIGYLPLLLLGSSVTVWQLLKERRHHLDKWNKKKKPKRK